MRWIAHLDMDAFYASVELLRYPELRGLPVVVGGRQAHQPLRDERGAWRFARLRDYVGRGVATTATYEARALGARSGMGLMKAAAAAPDAILLPADFDQYRKYSRLFKSAVAGIAPVIEDRGIDEIYIDLSDVPGSRTEAPGDPLAGVRDIGRRLKAAVTAATGLTCSLGITPNKLLSKICSEFDKPDGLTVLTSDEIPSRIWPLPARAINGIGPKAAARLEGLGIRTIGELAAADADLLIRRFGEHYGRWLHEAAHGRDPSPVVTEREPQSISRETTFERDLDARRDRAELGRIFTGLCERVAEDLQKSRYRACSIAIKLRFDDFRCVTRAITVDQATDDAARIRQLAGQCLKRITFDRRLRLLGVRAASLIAADSIDADALPAATTLSLF
jgi:DNA polymerase-4